MWRLSCQAVSGDESEHPMDGSCRSVHVQVDIFFLFLSAFLSSPGPTQLALVYTDTFMADLGSQISALKVSDSSLRPKP